MAQITKSVTIIDAKSAGVSRNGNSYYSLETDKGVFKTSQNGTASTQIMHHMSLGGSLSSKLRGATVTLQWTGRGTVDALLDDLTGDYL